MHLEAGAVPVPAALPPPPFISPPPPAVPSHACLRVPGESGCSSTNPPKRTETGRQICRSKKIEQQVCRTQTGVCSNGPLSLFRCPPHWGLQEREGARPEALGSGQEVLQDLNRGLRPGRAPWSDPPGRTRFQGPLPAPLSSQVGGGRKFRSAGLGRCCSGRARPYPEVTVGQAFPQITERPPSLSLPSEQACL